MISACTFLRSRRCAAVRSMPVSRGIGQISVGTWRLPVVGYWSSVSVRRIVDRGPLTVDPCHLQDPGSTIYHPWESTNNKPATDDRRPRMALADFLICATASQTSRHQIVSNRFTLADHRRDLRSPSGFGKPFFGDFLRADADSKWLSGFGLLPEAPPDGARSSEAITLRSGSIACRKRCPSKLIARSCELGFAQSIGSTSRLSTGSGPGTGTLQGVRLGDAVFSLLSICS